MADGGASVGKRDDLVARARAIVPALKAASDEAEANRRLTDETFAIIKEAGGHRVMQPAMFGGAEEHFSVMIDIITTMAMGCTSAAWVAAQYTSHNVLLGDWPLECQEEVWATRHNAIAGVVIPSCGQAERKSGGDWTLSGQWPFASGIHGADWFLATAFAEAPDEEKHVRMFLVPRAELEILDTWKTVGLRGTGSADVKVDAIKVPHHRSLSIEVTKGGALSPGSKIHKGPLCRLGSFAMFSINQATVALGLAQASFDAHMARVHTACSKSGRKIGDFATAQVKLAEASASIHGARLMLQNCCDVGMNQAATGEAPPWEMKGMLRGNACFAGNLATRAVELIHALAGGGGLYDVNPMSRAIRDVTCIKAHITQNWDVNGTNYGRLLLGLPSADPLI